jgi:hypothetical protein
MQVVQCCVEFTPVIEEAETQGDLRYVWVGMVIVTIHVVVSVPLKEFFVYYESMKREVKTRPVYECRCDERLKTKAEESTRLAYTGLLGELEHLKMRRGCRLF